MSRTSNPVFAEFQARNFVSAAGVAIFRVKSASVVVCYHTVDKYWFLPKGRRDAGESSTRAAEREGSEESGYRNRLLPLPIEHRQPDAAEFTIGLTNVVEPVWTSLLPMGRGRQYLLHWYIAETLPPGLEASIGPPSASRVYQQPPPFPEKMRLTDRLAAEPDGYKPTRYENTGVDAEEALYTSKLLPIQAAIASLGRNSMSEVVAIGWDRIQARLKEEAVQNVPLPSAQS